MSTHGATTTSISHCTNVRDHFRQESRNRSALLQSHGPTANMVAFTVACPGAKDHLDADMGTASQFADRHCTQCITGRAVTVGDLLLGGQIEP